MVTGLWLGTKSRIRSGVVASETENVSSFSTPRVFVMIRCCHRLLVRLIIIIRRERKILPVKQEGRWMSAYRLLAGKAESVEDKKGGFLSHAATLISQLVEDEA